MSHDSAPVGLYVPAIGEFRFFTRKRRFLAGVVDALFLMVFFRVVHGLFGGGSSVFETVASIAYSVGFHAWTGQTLGKRLCGVRVVSASGGRLSLGQALLRDSVVIAIDVLSLIAHAGWGQKAMTVGQGPTIANVTVFIVIAWSLLELVTMAFDKQGRAIHDHIAGSVVIRLAPVRVG